MNIHRTSAPSPLIRFRRSLLAGLFSLALVGTTQADADVITLTGDISATFTALGEGPLSGAPTLSYATVGPVATVGATKRAVTVRLLQALPPGVTISVRFSPDLEKGTSTGTLTLSTMPQVLVNQIGADINQTARPLSYTIYASTGFSSVNLSVEYTLIDN